MHQREIPNNLLAIEVRKTSNHQPPEHDRHKLQALTDPQVWLPYTIGVLLTLDKKGVATSKVYSGGAVDSSSSIWFAERLKQEGVVP